MAGLSAAGRAARLLTEQREAMAAEVTEALYRERPELMARYGDAGREKCLQDMRYNLEHLVPAVELERPELFEAYVRWVDELLRSRGVETGELRRALQLLAEGAAGRMDPDAAGIAGNVIRAGLAVLPGESR
jgi:hypothetical protein